MTEMLSLCPSCHCMTKIVDNRCGKCGHARVSLEMEHDGLFIGGITLADLTSRISKIYTRGSEKNEWGRFDLILEIEQVWLLAKIYVIKLMRWIKKLAGIA